MATSLRRQRCFSKVAPVVLITRSQSRVLGGTKHRIGCSQYVVEARRVTRTATPKLAVEVVEPPLPSATAVLANASRSRSASA